MNFQYIRVKIKDLSLFTLVLTRSSPDSSTELRAFHLEIDFSLKEYIAIHRIPKKRLLSKYQTESMDNNYMN